MVSRAKWIPGSLNTLSAASRYATVLLPEGLKALKRVAKEAGFDLRGAYLNLDGGFDSAHNRKCIFNAGLIPNIKENPRNRKHTKRGRRSMPGRFSGRHRRWRDAMALSPRCNTTIAGCPRVATRCGRHCITSIAGLRTGRHRRRDFSGGRFPICLRACCHRSTRCLCPGSVVRPSRQLIEGAGCPA